VSRFAARPAPGSSSDIDIGERRAIDHGRREMAMALGLTGFKFSKKVAHAGTGECCKQTPRAGTIFSQFRII
jgi:hypothetical protein